MTGSLQIKKDKYYMVLNTVDANGKRKPKWIATGLDVKGNKKRAEKLLRETLAEYEKVCSNPSAQMLFSDWVQLWLCDVEKRVDAVTFQGYAAVTRVHITPYFSDSGVTLAGINRNLLQAYVDEKSNGGRTDGSGGLSPASIRHHRNVLNQSLKLAVRNGLLPSNPCEGLRLPKMVRPEFSFYNAEQLQTLLTAIRDEPLYPMVKVTAVYGLRRSELLGLKWDSIDFNANTLSIRHTVVQQKITVRKDKTKNAASRRSFPLVPDVRKLLLDLREREKENRRLFGKAYIDSDYIFKWDDGQLYEPHYVSAKFSKLLAQYNLPHIRFHELRHPYVKPPLKLLAKNFLAAARRLSTTQGYIYSTEPKSPTFHTISTRLSGKT